MKLILKNKMIMAVKALVEEAEKKGGMPKHIELSEKEGKDLLAEVHYLTNAKLNTANEVKIECTKQLEDLQDPHHPAFLVRMVSMVGTQELLSQTVEQLIRFWGAGEIKITCFGIPLLVDWSPIKAESQWMRKM